MTARPFHAAFVLVSMLWLFANSASAMLHPQQGRFMQRDPLGYVDGMSGYACARSNPHARTDPSGQQATQPTGCCGPDVTSWLSHQAAINGNHPTIIALASNRGLFEEVLRNPGPNQRGELAALTAEYLLLLREFRDLVKPGAPWDFKRTAFGFDDARNRRGKCPSADCRKTVTLCGVCVNYDVPGNIHFGFVVQKARTDLEFAIRRAGGVQEGDAAGADDPVDVVATRLGHAWDGSEATLCSTFSEQAGSLNLQGTKGCEPCDEKY